MLLVGLRHNPPGEGGRKGEREGGEEGGREGGKRKGGIKERRGRCKERRE